MPHRSILLPNHPSESFMQRIAPKGFGIVLLIVLFVSGMAFAQSLADAARENRRDKLQTRGASTKVITGDDLAPTSTPEVIQLIPGSTATGQGTLVAPGRGKHGYR